MDRRSCAWGEVVMSLTVIVRPGFAVRPFTAPTTIYITANIFTAVNRLTRGSLTQFRSADYCGANWGSGLFRRRAARGGRRGLNRKDLGYRIAVPRAGRTYYSPFSVDTVGDLLRNAGKLGGALGRGGPGAADRHRLSKTKWNQLFGRETNRRRLRPADAVCFYPSPARRR